MPSAQDAATTDGRPSDEEIARADGARPAAPAPHACVAQVRSAHGSGFEGIRIEATPRTPETSLEDARAGILGGQSFLAACLGGDAGAAERSPLTLEIRSSSSGDERLPVPWEAAWGKWERGAGKIVADVNGTDGFPDAGWDFRADQRKTWAHEYTHIWHQVSGCGGTYPPVPAWFAEGLADYVGYGQGVARGEIPSDAARTMLWRVAWFDGQLDAPLSKLQRWPGHVGYFAMEDLVARAGGDPAALARVCREMTTIGAHDAFDQAFANVFRLSVAEFERAFFEKVSKK